MGSMLSDDQISQGSAAEGCDHGEHDIAEIHDGQYRRAEGAHGHAHYSSFARCAVEAGDTVKRLRRLPITSTPKGVEIDLGPVDE